jgi:hypothetical protein
MKALIPAGCPPVPAGSFSVVDVVCGEPRHSPGSHESPTVPTWEKNDFTECAGVIFLLEALSLKEYRGFLGKVASFLKKFGVEFEPLKA